MKRILLAVISFLPLLTFGQSMKIAPKQIEPGSNGQVIVTRSGVNVLDSLKWTDISAKPTDLEHTSNRVTNFNSPNNITYPTTAAVNNNFIASKFNAGNVLNQQNNFSLDSIINTNIFFGLGVTNAPSGNRGIIKTYSFGGNSYALQEYIRDDQDDSWWYRRKTLGGGWYPAYQVASRQWVNSQTFIKIETDPIYTADKLHLVRTDNVMNGTIYNYNGDVNSIANTSIMHIQNGSANTPFTIASGGNLWTSKYSNGYLTQLGLEFGQKPRAWIRNCYLVSNSPTFSQWKELLGAGDNISLFNNDAGYITATGVANIGNKNLTITDSNRYLLMPETSITHNLIIGDTSQGSLYNFGIGHNVIPQSFLPNAVGGLYFNAGNNAKIAINGTPGRIKMWADDYQDYFSQDTWMHLGYSGDSMPAPFNSAYTPFFIYTPNEGYISLSSNRSYFKTISGLDLINTGGYGIRLLDSSVGITMYTGGDININNGGNATFNPAFGFSMASGGPITFTSTSAPFQVTTPAPIQLTSEYSPIQIYAGSGSPIQLSTDAGSNGVNIFTHNVTGFQSYELPNESGTVLLDADTATFLATKNDIPTVNDDTLTLSTTIYGATNLQKWTGNSSTNKQWFIDVAGTNITTDLNITTGVLTTQSSTGTDDTVQLLTKRNDQTYLEPVGMQGVNTGGGLAATAQTIAFNGTYIEINPTTYTYYIVSGGNPAGGDIKLVDPADWPNRIIRIVNTSGATGTFINFSIVGLAGSVTTIDAGKYIVIQSVTNPSTGDQMWAQVGGNY